MSATTIPTMSVEAVELSAPPSLAFHDDPIACDHLWEPYPWETVTDQAYCAQCGASARWVNGPHEREDEGSAQITHPHAREKI